MASTRILNLPYTYALKAVLPRRRNEQAFEVRDYVPVPVAQVGDEDAPVAIVMEDGAGTEVSYRVHGGRLYLPVGSRSVDVESFAEDVTRPPEEWSSRTKAPWSPNDLPSLRGAVSSHSFRTVAPMRCPTVAELLLEYADQGRLRIRSDDKLSRQVEASQVLSEGLLIVDGAMWTTCHAWEPHYEVIEANGEVSVRLHLAVESLAYVHGFRLDREAEAVAFAAERVEVLSRGGNEWTLVDDRRRVGFLAAEALRLDHVVMIAGQILSSLGMKHSVEGEGWGDEAVELDSRLRGMSQPRRPLDPVESVEVVSMAIRLRELLVDVDGREARTFLQRSSPAVTRWMRHEAALRSELPALVDFDVMKAEDEMVLSML